MFWKVLIKISDPRSYDNAIFFYSQKTPSVQNKNPAAQRSQACPACRKPLPRCSVCLIHMGGIAAVEGGFLVKKMITPKSTKRRTKPFSLFFTWCQSCRHGGHASHLIDWFAEHQVLFSKC